MDDLVEYMYGADAEETAYDTALSSFWTGGLSLAEDKIKATVTFAGR